MEETVRVGPFTVDESIGEGGMGTVYRGRRAETDVPVALKVIRRKTDAQSQRRFHEEVQAQAGLVHPGIVYLFEYGTIDADAAAASDDTLRAGNPFVAMELADRGTLRDAMPLTSWVGVSRVLVQILDALAHAHARGVVHRDLKPENFLVFDPTGPSEGRRLKLADFGIAHAFGALDETDTDWLSSPSGTPHYMAPEQTRGNWRKYGPWTDLYALGCVAWELICGRPPFHGSSSIEVMVAHHEEERPPLEPRIPIPEGVESWVRRAMAIDPDRRFRRAAEALWALPRSRADSTETRLSFADDDSASEEAAVDLDAETVSGDSTDDPWSPEATTVSAPTEAADDGLLGRVETVTASGDAALPDESSEAAGSPESEVATRPPLPQSWRPKQTAPLPTPLVGTGLGLFGLRETPFVDRDDERDRIWETLRRVEQHEELQILIVSGDSGSGKSRLVEWMGRRAHELGGAELMRAVHSRGGVAAGEGVRGMVERLVRGRELERREFYEHLAAHLPPLEDAAPEYKADARALTELVFPTDDADATEPGPRYRFAGPGERCALVARLLRRYGRHRPPFVWLDDIQWGELGLSLVEHLLESSFELPRALVAVTVRSDLLADEDSLRERLATIASADRCRRLELDTLAPARHREFVEQLLPLQEGLADRIARRTEGNPLFADQLVGHLVERDRLQTGPSGFHLADEASLELPSNIHELWMRRLRRMVRDVAPEDEAAVWRAVERAATLGREVETREWRGVCEQVGLERPDDLRTALLERGLARRTDAGWAFTHGMLVESIERRIRRDGGGVEHHRGCARLLEQIADSRSSPDAARRAHHWEAAGEAERALDALDDRLERLEQFGSFERRESALEWRRRLLDEVDAPENDRRRLQNTLQLAECRLRLGADPESILEQIQPPRDRALRSGLDSLVAAAWKTEAKARARMGEPREARRALDDAVERARSGDDPRELVTSLIDCGWSDFYTGQLERAHERLSDARDRSDAIDTPYYNTLARRGLAWISLSRGRYRRAAELLEDVLEECRELGSRWLEAYVQCDLGDLARYDCDPEPARSHYDACREIVRELERPEEIALTDLKTALVELMVGDFDAATDHLDRAEHRYDALGQSGKRAFYLQLGRLAAAAGARNWPRFDALLDAACDDDRDDATLVKDHPWLLELAGDLAADADQPERARRTHRLAAEFYGRIGDTASRERLGREPPDPD